MIVNVPLGTYDITVTKTGFTREVDGLRVLLCHAVPSDPLFAYCAPDSDRWGQELELANADTVLVGHTHLPFIKCFGKKKVVNPGSLGQPKTGSPAACYAVWDEGKIELQSYEYPFEETIRKIQALPIAAGIKRTLADVLRHGGLSANKVARK